MTSVGDILVEYKELPVAGSTAPVLTLTEKNGFVRQADRFHKRLATEDTSKYKVVRENDIAFNPYLLWAGAVAQNTIVDEGIISPLYPTFKIRDGYDPRYVARLLLTPEMIAAYDAIAFGSVPRRRRSSTQNFLNLRIPTPPSLDEQRRITAILDQGDALRSKRLEVRRHIGQLDQSVFVAMFGEPIQNPRRYPLVPLGQVGDLDRGVSKHRPRNDPSLLGGPYPLIQTGDVTRSGGYITTYSSTYSELGLAQSKLWPAGTLCITIAANIAQTGILTFPACFPDSVVGFTADGATTIYVRTWLTFLQATLEASAPQSAQRNINLAILRDLPVPLPDIDSRKEFAETLNCIRGSQEVVFDAQNRLDELFVSLQSRAFSGDL